MVVKVGSNLGLSSGWDDGEGGWGTPTNINYQLLDALVNLVVEDHTAQTPPSAPAEGARYVVPAGATGAWQGAANKVALYSEGSWVFFTPATNWRGYSKAAKSDVIFTGATWVVLPIATSETDYSARFSAIEQNINLLTQQDSAHARRIGDVETAIGELEGKVGGAAVIRNIAQDYTLDVRDAGAYLNVQASDSCKVTVPAQSSADILVGSQIMIHADTDHTVSLEAEIGVVINAPYLGSLQLAGRGASISLIKRESDVWDVVGQTATGSAVLAPSQQYLFVDDPSRTFVVGPRTTRVVVDSGTSLPSLILSLPQAAASPGRVVFISSVFRIDALDLRVPTGVSLRGLPALIPAGATIGLQYHAPTNSWLPA